MKFFYLLLVLLSFAFAEDSKQLGIGSEPLLEPPTAELAEKRSHGLSKILRCPVCQGLNVADSRSDAAVAMKNRIHELVEMGYSDDQIVDYFTDRYGDWVLLRPREEHWVIWTVPIVMAVLGLIFIIVLTRMRQKAKLQVSPTDSVSASAPAEDVSDYRREILAELENE